MRDKFHEFFYPRPENQKQQGFDSNIYLRTLRFLPKVIISLLRIHGKTRFSNEFIQTLNPVIETPFRGNVFKFRTGHGRLYWRAKHGFDEQPLLTDWIDSWEKDDVFLDVGANIGTYTLYAGMRGIRTYACEVDLLNADQLYQNIFLNNLEHKITVLPFGISDKTEIKKLYLMDVSPGDALHGLGEPSYQLTKRTSMREIEVVCFTIDDLVQHFGFCPTKVKIDTDSNEYEVLLGSVNLLNTIDQIYVEIDEDFEKHLKALKLLELKGFVPIAKQDSKRKWSKGGNVLFEKDQKSLSPSKLGF